MNIFGRINEIFLISASSREQGTGNTAIGLKVYRRSKALRPLCYKVLFAGSGRTLRVATDLGLRLYVVTV
ncbi:hypothetical protein NIES25_00870 [Nostoc linckia NIES-25]|nr:hypothetical protein NIES25_00870 [Nostoc linckia NIES-25]